MRSVIGGAARDAFVRRVRLEMAKQGLTREGLAERAEVKERTLGNLLAGQAVRDQTVAKVARVLGIGLETVVGEASVGEAAPLAETDARAGEAYGGYMLSAYEGYIGTYVAWRRVFSRKREAGGELYRSVYEIDWDEQLSRLRFLELQRFRARDDRRISASQGGGIYISPYTGLIQLFTTFQGALRLVTLTRFRLGDNRLRGLILTAIDREQFFAPAASPIFLERIEGKARLADLERLVGAVGPADAAYAAAARELDEIEATTAVLAGKKE